MVTADAFKDAMGRFATGVTVVTVDTPSGPRGLTVNAFMSLSLEPPLVGVAIAHRARTYDRLRESQAFAVSILAEEQEVFSNLFAGAPSEAEPSFETLAGVSVLSGAVAQVACRIEARHAVGDHDLFVGRVTDLNVNGGTPLLYHRGRYGIG